MNIPQSEQELKIQEPETQSNPPNTEPVPSPFIGLVKVGQMFPLNGVWCQVAKITGPHIVLTATEYTTKVKRLITHHTRKRRGY